MFQLLLCLVFEPASNFPIPNSGDFSNGYRMRGVINEKKELKNVKEHYILP